MVNGNGLGYRRCVIRNFNLDGRPQKAPILVQPV